MNGPIVRLYGLMLVLFAALVGFTSYWAVFDSSSLKANSANRRPLIQEQQVKRGFIKTSDGVTLAESHPVGGGAHPVYVRDYPQGSLYGNPVGYSFVNTGQTGIERSENPVLAGERNEFTSILDQLRGIPQAGDNVTLTINSHAQQVATQALQNAIASTPGASGSGGAVVALDPSTGAVDAMASVPGYDPNKVKNTQSFEQITHDKSAPIVNRATQSTYPPGSTMKVVTAAAALDSGQFTPSTTLTANSPTNIGGVPLFNDSNQSFGSIDMTFALTNSVNTYFAQVGERLGTSTMVEYMKRFGFYSDPELDYPSDQMAASGAYNSSGDLVTSGFDVGRVAIGQGGAEGQNLATPLQMAEVAATVANGGRLMQPTFVQQVTDSDGRVTQKLSPHLQSTAISPQTATELTDMMTHVTQEGTAAGLTVNGPSGNVTFAGKTGTAEIGDPANGINQPWFIAFAPAQDPQVAVAATIERCQGCFGAEVAGPVATQVMDTILNGG
jgi:peptidoglycan glycosyltransferase